jgi:hypothetical protein
MLCSALLSPAVGAVSFPKPGLTDLSAGYLSVTIGASDFRGSAVIAKDPRLLFSCAHALFENGQWATSYTFSVAHHASFPPSSGASPRGFRYFSSYAGNVSSFGSNAPRTYNLDLVVMYGFESFGNAVGYWPEGGSILADRSYFKRIVGYPGSIDFTGASGEHYQHATDYFQDVAAPQAPAYYVFDNVSTGGGNSGGPVYAFTDGADYLAGILVSGTETSAGVRVLDSAALTMATDALSDANAKGKKTRAKTVKNTQAFRLPDNAQRYSVRSFDVKLAGTITRLLFSTDITTTYRGDLDVYLRAPSGRVKWVSKQSRDAADNLVSRNADFTARYRGRLAAGKWQLFMRDAVRGDRARFNSAALRISAAQ